MAREIFNTAEQAAITLAVFDARTDRDVEKLLERLGKIFIAKLGIAAEGERLLGIKSL